MLSRAHYLPLFSRLGAVRPRRCSTAPRTTRRGGCSSTGATRRRCCRSSCSRCCAGGWSARARRRLGRDAPDRSSERPELVAEVLAEVRERGPGRRQRGARARAADAHRAVVGLVATSSARSSGCSGAGRSRRARRRGFERLYDLPERVLPARGPRRADARPSRTPSASCCAIAARVARRRDRAATCATTSGCPAPRRSARVAELVEAGELLAGRGRGLARAGLPAPRRARAARASTPARCVGPFDSLIWERAARRAPVRLPLPDRDLRARRPSACTATTCCRSCSATGSSRASTSRPTARRARCACRPRTPSRTRRRRPRRSWPRSSRRWPAGSGSSASTVAPRGDLAPALAGTAGELALRKAA